MYLFLFCFLLNFIFFYSACSCWRWRYWKNHLCQTSFNWRIWEKIYWFVFSFI